MSFKRVVTKSENSLELHVFNKSGRVLYAHFVLQYGVGVNSHAIDSVRATNFGLTNRIFRYELSRFSTTPVDLLDHESQEDLFLSA